MFCRRSWHFRFVMGICGGALAVAAFAGNLDAQDSGDRLATLLYNTSSRLFRQKNWSEAAESFGEFLARHANHADAPEARFARGYCFNRLGKHAAAVEDFRKIRKREKERWAADANFYLARSLEALAGDANADEVTRRKRFLEAADGFATVARIRASKLGEKGLSAVKKKEILQQQVQAIAAQGEMLYRANSHGRAAEALAPLMSAPSRYQRAPSYARGLYYLALARYGLAKRAGAGTRAAELRAAIAALEVLSQAKYEAEPLWSEAAFLLAGIYRGEKVRDRAVALYDRIELGNGPRSAEAAFNRAMVRYESRQSDELKLASVELARFCREKWTASSQASITASAGGSSRPSVRRMTWLPGAPSRWKKRSLPRASRVVR